MTSERLRENIFFYGIFLLLGILTAILLWPFVSSLLIALALLVILKPLYVRLLPKRLVNNSTGRATALTLTIFILILVIPIIWFVGTLITQANAIMTDISTLTVETVSSSEDIITRLQSALEAGTSDNTARQLSESIQALGETLSAWFTDALLAIIQVLPSFFVNVVIVLVLLMVALPRYNQPDKDKIAAIIPLPAEITQLYLDKIGLMIMAMFKGTFVIAIVQGTAMGVVFWLAGVPYTAILTVICIFLALLPMIGISLIAWPVGILLILNGNVWQGVFVIGMFLIVIAQIDTFLRPQLVPKGAYLNSALVLLSVFGGITLMGMIGVIYGPVIMVLLVTTIEIYAKYYAKPDVIRADGKIDLHTLGLIPDEDVPDEDNVFRKAGNSVRRGASRILSWAVTEAAADGGQETGDGGLVTADGGQQTADGGPLTGDGGRETGDKGTQTADGGPQTVDGGPQTVDGVEITGDNVVFGGTGK